MLAAGRGGAIVNIGSVNSFLGFPGGAAYAASKHGLIGLTWTASAELAPRGIRVNLICPGIIDTPMHRRGRQIFGDELYDNFLTQRIHTRRAGQPEEVARSILFLGSGEASYITATTHTPDGGFHLTL
jgi:NAD(P)-dependent dehydrogenase (short-subunit alcohol dehydrogenase family)